MALGFCKGLNYRGNKSKEFSIFVGWGGVSRPYYTNNFLNLRENIDVILTDPLEAEYTLPLLPLNLLTFNTTEMEN